MTILVLSILGLLILGLTVLRCLSILLAGRIWVSLRLRILRLLVDLLSRLVVLCPLALTGIWVLLWREIRVAHVGKPFIFGVFVFQLKVFFSSEQ